MPRATIRPVRSIGNVPWTGKVPSVVLLASPAAAAAWFTVCLTIIAGLTVGCERPAPVPPGLQSATAADDSAGPGDAVTRGVVTVMIELPAGEQTRRVPDVVAGATLESVLRQIRDPVLTMTGEGTTAMLTAVNGVQNDGRRGWTFQVDGQFATQGIGSTRVNPPTTIRWRYTTFEEAMATSGN